MDCAHSGRAFVFDPVCLLPFGHNVAALSYFREFLRPRFAEAHALCSRLLPAPIVAAQGFEPVFDHYYQGFLEGAPDAGPPAGPTRPELFRDPIEDRATADAEAILERFGIGEADAAFFPSVDFYGVVGLLNALAARPAATRPRVYLRFIGVMETASHAYRDPLGALLDRIGDARDAGVRLAVAAETPRWADHLASRLDSPVSVTVYPSTAAFAPPPEDPPFVVFCPGSARLDKGYLHLFEIIAAVRRRDPGLAIRFVTQSLPGRLAALHERYESQLYALPGVDLLPSAISAAEMAERYARCHAVLLPYDAETYRFRGSAVLMEAAYLGRPAVALDGAGFADQIRYYGLGVTSPGVDGLADAILALAAEPAEARRRRAFQARSRFAADAVSAYDRFLGAA